MGDNRGVHALRRAFGAVEDAAASPWAERLASAGLTARGVVYCVVAILAVQLPTGKASPANKDGALVTVAHQPLGRILLVVLALGFAAYAAWRFLEAAVGRRGKDGVKSAAVRLADVARGAVYLVLLASAVAVLVDDNDSAREEEPEWTARVLAHGGGRALVIGIGLGLVGVGVYLAVRGARQKFRKSLDTASMSARARCWLPRLGTLGYVSRGVVAALIGWFLAKAALDFDPAESVGVDGALRRLAAQPYGPWLLALVAAGLLAFGLFSFVEARYRRVLENA